MTNLTVDTVTSAAPRGITRTRDRLTLSVTGISGVAIIGIALQIKYS